MTIRCTPSKARRGGLSPTNAVSNQRSNIRSFSGPSLPANATTQLNQAVQKKQCPRNRDFLQAADWLPTLFTLQQNLLCRFRSKWSFRHSSNGISAELQSHVNLTSPPKGNPGAFTINSKTSKALKTTKTNRGLSDHNSFQGPLWVPPQRMQRTLSTVAKYGTS